MTELSWEYGIRYDRAPQLRVVGNDPVPYPPAAATYERAISWGTCLGEERSKEWAQTCATEHVTAPEMSRIIVRRLVGPVEEWKP